MKKQIVTGLASFDKIASGEALYVDKTLFAKDVFHSGSEAMLILRPRRWGKSLNLAMLKYFLEAPLQKESQNPGAIDFEQLETKKAFFKDKKVLLEDPEMSEHLGKYSVISISLGGIQTETKELFFEDFGKSVRDLFKHHSKVIPFLSQDEKESFNVILNLKGTQSDLSKSILFLSSILARVYQSPIWLLLDEYDATVNTVWEKALKKESVADELLNSLVQFFGAFYETSVKGNQHVYRTLFTGVFRVLKGSMGTSMNNFREYSFLSKVFARDFGFTKEEILTTLHEIEIPKDKHPEKLQEASDWYNGYQSTLGSVYNPWSIMYWLSEGEVKNYWVNMGSLDIILALSQYNQYTEELSQLVVGKPIQGNLLWGLVLRQCQPNSERLKDAFWTLLAFSGYISIEREIENLGDQILCEFKLPNQELKKYFNSCLLSDFRYRYKISDSDARHWIQDLLEGDWKAFEKKLKDLLRKVISTFDVAENKAEVFYQGFFIGLIAHCDKNYFIRSEFPTGKGRADFLLIPRSEKVSKLAILLEYKVGESLEELPVLAKEALSQLLERDYHAEVENHSHITQSLSLGLSFYGKDFSLEKREWKK